jgi:hypothetical protein
MMIGPGSSNVVGGQFAFIKADGRCIDDMVVLAPAAMKVAFGENPKGNYNELGMIPTTRMTMAAMLREELFNARQYLKNKEDAEKNGEKFEMDFKAECWVPVLKKQIPLKAHVHRADDILSAIRIAREFDLDMTLDHCTEGHLIAKEIKGSGFPAIIGPTIGTARDHRRDYRVSRDPVAIYQGAATADARNFMSGESRSQPRTKVFMSAAPVIWRNSRRVSLAIRLILQLPQLEAARSWLDSWSEAQSKPLLPERSRPARSPERSCGQPGPEANAPSRQCRLPSEDSWLLAADKYMR